MGANPQTGQKLASAMGKVIASGCEQFMARVFMEPGVVCAVAPPPAMAGSVAGIGRLGGSPPTASELRAQALSAVARSGLSRPGQESFADTISKLGAKGFELFKQFAQVMPGTPITGGATTTPARLNVQTQMIKSQLDMLVLGMSPRPGPNFAVSELPADFPKIVTATLVSTFNLMAQTVMVRPSIPIAGNVTAGPGLLF